MIITPHIQSGLNLVGNLLVIQEFLKSLLLLVLLEGIASLDGVLAVDEDLGD